MKVPTLSTAFISAPNNNNNKTISLLHSFPAIVACNTVQPSYSHNYERNKHYQQDV